jgi:hypothetical protein
MFDQALKVAEGIEDAWWRAEALMAIAMEMAKAGEVEGAGRHNGAGDGGANGRVAVCP